MKIEFTKDQAESLLKYLKIVKNYTEIKCLKELNALISTIEKQLKND
jgi:hypothetical protein